MDIGDQWDHRMLIVQILGDFRGHAAADQLDGGFELRLGQFLAAQHRIQART